MPTLSEVLATDLRNVIDNDFPERVKVKNVICEKCLVEDLVGAEMDEAGGPALIGNTRVHFQTYEIETVEIGTLITLLDRENLVQIVMTSSLSPDKNHIIVTVKDP